MRPGRHGPRRSLLADLDASVAFGVTDPTVRPVRGRFGEFEVAGPAPALAQGSIVVGDVPAGAGASVALPSVYLAHLEGGLRRVAAVTTAGDVRALPWPFMSLAGAVDDALRREGDGWEGLGCLPDDAPLWSGWADGFVARRGFRVAVPWAPAQGALGYGRWLPHDLVEHAVHRDDGLRTLDLDADHLVAVLRWHGLQAHRADDRLAAVLVGWTSTLPSPATSDCAGRPSELVVVPQAALPLSAR